jgi:hypothetical protein
MLQIKMLHKHHYVESMPLYYQQVYITIKKTLLVVYGKTKNSSTFTYFLIQLKRKKSHIL